MTNTKAKTAIDVIRNLRVKQADRMILYFHLTLRGSYCVLTARRVVFGPRVWGVDWPQVSGVWVTWHTASDSSCPHELWVQWTARDSRGEIPTNTGPRSSVVLMPGQRRRRWPSINASPDQRPVFARIVTCSHGQPAPQRCGLWIDEFIFSGESALFNLAVTEKDIHPKVRKYLQHFNEAAGNKMSVRKCVMLLMRQ